MFEDDFDENKEFEELISRFEKYVNEGEYAFFDLQDILDIVDYYNGWMDRDMQNKAIEIGLQYFPNAPEILLKKAELLAQQSYTLEALKILHQIEKQLPEDPRFYLTKGEIYAQMGLSEQAIHEYKKILELDYPNKDTIHNIIASEYIIQNKFINALHHLKKAITFNPFNHATIYKIYLCYSELNKLDECISFFKEIIDEHPFHSDVWLYLAHCYYDLNDYEMALDSINYAIAINPNDLIIVLKKSDILKTLKKHHEAIEVLEAAFKKDKQNTYLMQVMANTYFEMEEYEKAAQYFQKVIKYNSKDSHSWIGLARTFVKLWQDNEAVSCIEQAIQNTNQDPDILIEAGKLYLELDLYEDALRVLLKVNPENEYLQTEFFMWLSIALEKSGYAKDAIDLLTDQIYNQQNTDVELLYCLAGILLLYQYRQEGLSTLQSALEKDPTKYTIIYEFSAFFQDDLEIQSLIQQYISHNP